MTPAEARRVLREMLDEDRAILRCTPPLNEARKVYEARVAALTAALDAMEAAPVYPPEREALLCGSCGGPTARRVLAVCERCGLQVAEGSAT